MTAQPNPPPLFSENPEGSGLGYYGAPTRPLYWSVWRELWENHSIYIAPLIVAVVQVFGFAISVIGLAERRRAVLLLADPVKQRAAIEVPYDIAAMMMLFTVFIVGVFYFPDDLVSFSAKNVVATAIFVFAAVTDWLDGFLARRLNQMSAFGAFLDPVADKLFVVGALIVLLFLGRVDPLVALIIIGREIAISALRE